MRYWLMKSEPDVYSIADLKRDGSTFWEGVRNYTARNFLRDDMKPGDLVLFYHSRIEPMGVAGVARICREGYPDDTAWDPKNPYFDEKCPPGEPRWMRVDVEHVETFPRVVTLAEMKANPALEGMPVIMRGQRLSVQPVSDVHFALVMRMAREVL